MNYLLEVRNTIALNIDRIVTNGVSNDMFTLLVRIFFGLIHLLDNKHAPGQIDPGTPLMFLTNEHNRTASALPARLIADSLAASGER